VHDVAGFLDGTLATGMDPASDWVASKFGPVIAFDGASDDITVGTEVTEAIKAVSAFTLTMRIFCTDSASDNALFGSWSSNFLLWRDEYASGDRYGFATKAPGTTLTFTGNGVAKTNEWQTVTVVYDTAKNDCAIWLDGVDASATGGSAPTITGTAQSAAIGADFSGNNLRVFNGQIAETLLHFRALTENEIRQLYRDPLAPFRQRRFTPTYSTAAEEAAATTSVGWTRSLTPSPVRPSYKSGFARSKSESAFPGLWDSLAGAWCPGLGVTGDTLFDQSGNRNDGTLTSMDVATDWVPSPVGKALDFDGVNDRISQPHVMNASEDITLHTLIYPRDAANYQTLAGVRTDSNSKGWWLRIDGAVSGDPLTFGFAGGSQFVSDTNVLTFDSWNSVSLTHINGTATFYVNGIQVGSGSTSGYDHSTYSYLIGARYVETGWFTLPFDGLISCFYQYGRGLQPTEIRQLYRDPLAPFRQRRFTPTISGAAEAAAEWQPYWGLHATRFAGILT